MAVKLDQEIITIIKDKDTIKVLATTDGKGVPHLVFKQSLHVGVNGNLVFLELLESSQTNKNMVRGIWLDRLVAVNIKSKDGISYQIKGKPVKATISGLEFQKHYQSVRERLGDVDLSTVWEIEAYEVINQTYTARKAQAENDGLYFTHLDRIAK